MKKEVKIAIAAFVAVWIFIIGIEVGVYKERKANFENSTTVAPPVITTEAPTESTTQPTTETTTQPTTQVIPSTDVVPSSDVNANVSVSESTTAALSNDPALMTKDQVLEKVVSYMAQVKSEQNMTAVKKENITVNLTELSISAAKSIVNTIISNLVGDGPTEVTYTFSGGQASDPENNGNMVTPNDVIPPTSKAFSLTSAGVKEGKAEKIGDNTVYTLILVEESTTLDNPEPTHNAVAIGYLNLGGIDVSPAKLTKADMHYPGSTVVVTVDANDKVIGLKNELPMTGDGEAEVWSMTGSASFEGALNEEWTFSY